MERREFIKTSCTFCLTIGSGLLMSSLASCGSAAVYTSEIVENKVMVPMSLFTEQDVQIIRPRNLGYDIALRKQNDGSFSALLLRCTHAENQLSTTGTEYYCSLHGSRFNSQGVVTRGPAEFPLKQFSTRLSGNYIIIALN